MLDIILCSHSTFSTGLLSAAEMIYGPQEKVKALSLLEDGSLEALSADIRAAYEEFHAAGDDVVCLVDAMRATPYNAAFLALADTDTAILPGMSLPMLLDLFTNREDYDDLAEVLQCAVDTAKESTIISRPKEELAAEEE